jgi:hypothetical protein
MQALETQTSIEVNFSPLLRRYTLEEFWACPNARTMRAITSLEDFFLWFRRQTRLTGCRLTNERNIDEVCA